MTTEQANHLSNLISNIGQTADPSERLAMEREVYQMMESEHYLQVLNEVITGAYPLGNFFFPHFDS